MSYPATVVVKNTYVYKWTEDYWTVGNFVGDLYAPNGVLNSQISNCPETIDFPGTYTDKYNRKGEVIIVDNRAFHSCAQLPNGKTKHVKLPKEVKLLRESCFDRFYDLETFVIEEGSRLEEIGLWAIAHVGDGRDNSKIQISLVLPYSLLYVSEEGVNTSPRIKKIIYCGYYVLNEDLQIGGNAQFLVTERYKFRTIFKKEVDRKSESLLEAEEACIGQTPSFLNCNNFNDYLSKFTLIILLMVIF